MRLTRPSKLDPHKSDLRQWFGVEKITLATAQTRLAAVGLSVSQATLSDWWQRDQVSRMTPSLDLGALSGMSHFRVAAIAGILVSCTSKEEALDHLRDARRNIDLEILRLSENAP